MKGSRETYSFKWDIKRKNWRRFLKNLIILVFLPLSNRWDRKYIIEDNIRVPFNKRWGCKLFNHRWTYYKEDDSYFCKDCYKLTKSDDFISEKRSKALKDLGVK
jgi:hypothetical protein